MKILIAGFEGEDNSAKILLDNMKEECNQDTLYLENNALLEGIKLETDIIMVF